MYVATTRAKDILPYHTTNRRVAVQRPELGTVWVDVRNGVTNMRLNATTSFIMTMGIVFRPCFFTKPIAYTLHAMQPVPVMKKRTFPMKLLS